MIQKQEISRSPNNSESVLFKSSDKTTTIAGPMDMAQPSLAMEPDDSVHMFKRGQ